MIADPLSGYARPLMKVPGVTLLVHRQ